MDPRTPEALAAPTPQEWQAAAAGIAGEIAAALEDRDDDPAVSLDLVESGGADIDLESMLLAELVLAGVPMAVESETARMSLHCRVSPTGTTERPRGVVAAAVEDPTAETTVLCLLTDRGRYVAVARRALPPHPVEPDDAVRGIVLEING